ncbi:hypothetical protein MTR67_001941, partial [Solanum verrucosum]
NSCVGVTLFTTLKPSSFLLFNEYTSIIGHLALGLYRCASRCKWFYRNKCLASVFVVRKDPAVPSSATKGSLMILVSFVVLWTPDDSAVKPHGDSNRGLVWKLLRLDSNRGLLIFLCLQLGFTEQ